MKRFFLSAALILAAPCSPTFADNSTALAPEAWASLRQAYESAQHAFVSHDHGGHSARSLTQRWRSRFDKAGFTVTPDEAGWTWGLELRRFGLAGSEQAVAANHGRLDAKKLTYQRNQLLEEWFVNDSRGLEQGWTILQRPEGEGRSNPIGISRPR